jgi:hypothetical protein
MKEFPQESPPEVSFFNGKVFRNAAITIGLSFVGGFLIGILRSMGGFSMNSYILLIGASNLFSITLGGVISGLSVPRESLVRHLQAVGLLVWLFGLVNVALGITDFAGFIFSSVFVAACVALGGWISGLLANPRD